MRTLPTLMIGSAALALAHTAHAEIPHTLLQADYQNISIDAPVDVSADGYGLQAQLQIGPTLYLLGRYRNFDTDVFEVIQDELFGEQIIEEEGRLALETYSAGLGLRIPLQANAHIIAEVAYERSRAEAQQNLAFLGSETHDGYSAAAGLRFMVLPQVELRGDVTFIELDGSDTLLRAEIVGYLLPLFSVVGGYTRGSDIDGYHIGLRFNF